jgi:hypothetical protein
MSRKWRPIAVRKSIPHRKIQFPDQSWISSQWTFTRRSLLPNHGRIARANNSRWIRLCRKMASVSDRSRKEDGASIWHSRGLGTISLSEPKIDTQSGYTVTRHATLESYSIPARLLSIGLFTKRLICPRVQKKAKITTRINTVLKSTKRNPRNHQNW